MSDNPYSGSPNTNALIEGTTMAAHANHLVMSDGDVLTWQSMTAVSAIMHQECPLGISDISGLEESLGSKALGSVLSALNTTYLAFVDYVAGFVASVAPVAFTGSYNDLSSKPTIPSTFDSLSDGTTNKSYTSTEKTKLSGIAIGATANSTDAQLRDRSTHTGTQSVSTITGLATVATSGSYNDLGSKPTIPVVKAYQGITSRLNAFPIFKSGTVASGTVAFHLTDDGLSTGNALFPNGIIDESVNAYVSDAAASYQMSHAWSNGNKTLTVTVNKLTTSNILSGILGQAQANTAVVRLQVWGY